MVASVVAIVSGVGALFVALVNAIYNRRAVQDCEKREQRLYDEVQVYKKRVEENNRLISEYAFLKRQSQIE